MWDPCGKNCFFPCVLSPRFSQVVIHGKLREWVGDSLNAPSEGIKRCIFWRKNKVGKRGFLFLRLDVPALKRNIPRPVKAAAKLSF